MEPNSLPSTIRYLRNPWEHWDAENRTKSPLAQGCMHLMGLMRVNRLFHREDLHELLTRMPLYLGEDQVIDRYFKEGGLVQYHFAKTPMYIGLEELLEMVGLQEADLRWNYYSREGWMELSYHVWETHQLRGLLMDPVAFFPNDEVPKGVQKDPTEEEVENAEEFASSVMKEVGDEPFQALNERAATKLKELELRREPLELPEFNFESLPVEKQKKLWRHWHPDLEYFDDPEERKWIGKLVWLAWLWANGLIIRFDDGVVATDERIPPVDEEEFPTWDGDTDIRITFEEEELDLIFPLLEDPKLQERVNRPWKVWEE